VNGSLTALAPSTSEHGPTQALLDALRENAWGVKWHSGGAAMLVHPERGNIEVEIDPNDVERLTVFIDGRQVSNRMAMERIRGDAPC
jgi:hypothetical protein